MLHVEVVEGNHGTGGVRIHAQPQLYFTFECSLTPQNALKQEAAAAEYMPGQRVGKDFAATEPE